MPDPFLSTDASRRLVMVELFAPDVANRLKDAVGVESHHAGCMYLSLHIGASATQDDEATYPGYGRLVVPRSREFWRVDHETKEAALQRPLTFPQATADWSHRIGSVAARLPDGAHFPCMALDRRTFLFIEPLVPPIRSLRKGDAPTIHSIRFRVKQRVPK